MKKLVVFSRVLIEGGGTVDSTGYEKKKNDRVAEVRKCDNTYFI